MNPLPFGGLNQAGQDTMGEQTIRRSCPEANFAEDDHFTQRLLGLVVGRGDIRDTEEGEKIFLFRPQKISSERFGRLESQRLFTDFVKLPDKAILYFNGSE